MKIKYTQIYTDGEIMGSRIKIVENVGEEPQYTYDDKVVTEQEAQGYVKKFKQVGSTIKEITIYNDSDEKITEVSYFDGDNRTSLTATIKSKKETFEYKQIKEKIGRMYVNGVFARSYIKISLGDERCEYIDRQPDLDDPLLTERDKRLTPFMDVMSGVRSLSQLKSGLSNNEVFSV